MTRRLQFSKRTTSHEPGRFDWGAFFVAFLYLPVPYWLLLVLRCYLLVKGQAYRRALKRDEDFRGGQGEQTKLVKKQWGGA